ncbi:carboxymuconolactone decarboxylase family protein [Ancylobacter sp. MQZ15Z-1]|uniref:Carboxymuconolactone decarboxylase family protein n=1 Tax=Ancylobacter mangrovi TaxID=2972472 RepID=A0A9X2T1S0_9HYPH|nr:carboxymuconolactone decarboxylase family protein [Ancylobacter mangrovi]MCS0495067.1 carboxymuconolactone decarboxylase family protein [Ancylobacter mangrovi]
MADETRPGDGFLSRDDTGDERLARGKAQLARITGRSGEEVMAALADVAPDFARYIFEFGYGDIYSRPGLDLRTRLLATVAGLVCLGHAQRELEVHIGSALNCGASRQEVIETIMQMALYAGFPAALDALFVARKVFAAREEAGTPPAQG